ncbi:hypothetical protein [Arthrobacter sp. zg-Y1219]|uniref:hypothetical protein n=1 Tax=Arthrobacter sp. zg-Y1219 TaxID=3049067 RepID=UPI0032E3AB78
MPWNYSPLSQLPGPAFRRRGQRLAARFPEGLQHVFAEAPPRQRRLRLGIANETAVGIQQHVQIGVVEVPDRTVDRQGDFGLGIGIVVHIVPLLLEQSSLGSLVEDTVLYVATQMIAKK